MLVCIPSDGADAEHDTVCRHFGSAPYFTLYDTEQNSVQVIENANAHHSHGQCHPMTQLDPYHIDGLVCAGLGRRAADNLQRQGIAIYRAGAKTVGEVIVLARENKLIVVDPSEVGCGEGHHHETRRPLSTGTNDSQGRGPGITRSSGPGQGLGRNRGAGQGRHGGGRSR